MLQKETFRKLLYLIDRGSIPQAILIRAPAGSGIEYLAEMFGMAILCETNPPPCKVCRSCQLVTGGNNPSFFVIGPENGEIKVSQIRNLRPELAKKTFLGNRRVLIIREADRMNRSAANSLLKILEEPPGGVHFILTSSQAGRVLPTVRSRCFTVYIPPPTEDELARFTAGEAKDRRGTKTAEYAQFFEGNLDISGKITSGKIPRSREIITALVTRDTRKITDIAASFKNEDSFRHGLIILKRLLLDLLLLAKDEKRCIMNREIAEEGKVKRLIANPQELVELYHRLSALEFVTRQTNRAFICESILLSLSDPEAV